MNAQYIVLFLYAVFGICNAAIIDTLPKCKISDQQCLGKLYETIIRDIGKTGILELNIPPFDPIQLQNVTVNIADVVDLTLVEGVAKGVRDCIFKDFNFDILAHRVFQENICDITIKGKYKAYSTSPLVKALLGGDAVHGEGDGKVSMEKLHLIFNSTVYPEKRSDGEIYLKCLYDDIAYDYDIQGKINFEANNLYLGDQELSKPIIAILNENAPLIMKHFGRPFIAKATEFYFKFASYFFDAVPAKYYISDDLSDLVVG